MSTDASSDRVPTSEEIGDYHDSWGDESRLLRIGAQAVELVGLDDELAGLADRELAGFIAGDDSTPTMNLSALPTGLEILEAPEPCWLAGEGAEARIDFRASDDWIEVWSASWAGRFDREARSARMLLCEPDNDAAAARSLEQFLRTLVGTTAQRKGGFLLAGSAYAKAGESWVFPEPLAGAEDGQPRLPAGAELLGRDMILIENAPSGWRACGVPFGGSRDGEQRHSSACAGVSATCLIHAPGSEPSAGTVIAPDELRGALTLDDVFLKERATTALAEFLGASPQRHLARKETGDYSGALESVS